MGERVGQAGQVGVRCPWFSLQGKLLELKLQTKLLDIKKMTTRELEQGLEGKKGQLMDYSTWERPGQYCRQRGKFSGEVKDKGKRKPVCGNMVLKSCSLGVDFKSEARSFCSGFRQDDRAASSKCCPGARTLPLRWGAGASCK